MATEKGLADSDRVGNRRKRPSRAAARNVHIRATEQAMGWLDGLCDASGQCGSDLIWDALRRLAESDFPSVLPQPPRLN